MSEIKPALTAEEWAELLDGEYGANPPGYLHATERITDERCHGMAASCLFGQPFGFTREMLEALAHRLTYSDRADGESFALVEQLQANLEALLPPEDE